MKEYIKPSINEEVLEIEDVIAASNGGKGDVDVNGQNNNVNNLWPNP